MSYNKLVRDNIPEIIRSRGEEPVTHIADDVEYWRRLKEKLREEVEEFLNDETEEELADIFEVIDALIEHKGFRREEIELLQSQKAEKRGKFESRIVLDSVDE